MNILGVSAFFHDSAAVLVRDGRIIAAAQEERFTRVKGDASMPLHAVAYCLREGGITMRDVDVVAFYEKPFLKFERILSTYIALAPHGFPLFLRVVPLWLRQRLRIKERLRDALDYAGEMIFPEHHASHAASAFYPSPFAEAAILTLDGVGEWTTTSYGVGARNRIEILSDIKFPHSIGLLYAAFTSYLGFKINSGEYKVMGLAPYGEPKYAQAIFDHLIDLKSDGSFRLNMDYFDYCTGLRMTNERFDELFSGRPREPESELTPRHLDLARSVQAVIEETTLRMGRHIHHATGQSNLCLAGGVALNCVANARLLREELFENIWIQPAANDAGGALGAALIGWHQFKDQPREVVVGADAQQGSFLGPKYDDRAIEEFLMVHRVPYRKRAEAELLDEVADLIADGKVIGWFQGRMEFGPRSLGARAILADARNPSMQSAINRKIKFRESFRPFAPSVLAERVGEWFDFDRDSPFMLFVAPVKKNRRRALSATEAKLNGLEMLQVARSTIPAVTHVDWSARLQTVRADAHPIFHRLLRAFERKHDCPVLINTSFNVRGEPIVCTPLDAYRCFMQTEMDYLVMGDCLLEKSAQPPLKADFNAAFAHSRPEAAENHSMKKNLRGFGMILGAILLAWGALSVWRGRTTGFILLTGGALSLATAALRPQILAVIYHPWMRVARFIGKIVSTILLTLLYFGGVMPTTLLLRLLRKDVLNLRLDPDAETYWEKREPARDNGDTQGLSNQF